MNCLKLLAPLLAFSLLQACTEPKEGCLDIEATNFDASADKNCCCVYPGLKLGLSQRFGSAIWFADTVYTNDLHQAFLLKNAVFYLSGFRLYRNGIAYTVSDTVHLRALDAAGDTATRILTDDFVLLRRTASEYTVGQFLHSGYFDAVKCLVGLDADARAALPASAKSTHPLYPQPENLWQGNDTNYIAMRLVVQRDTSAGTAPDTLYFNRFDFEQIEISQNAGFRQETGYDLKIQLTIDYLELFRGVDWQNGTIPAWKARIVANLPNAFLFSP